MPTGLSTPITYEFVLELDGVPFTFFTMATLSPVLDRQPETKRKNSPLYKVILHDDPINTIEYVAVCIKKIMGYGMERAVQITLEVHTTGSSVVTVCDLEPAEHYCECFKSKGLTSTIEKDE